MSVHICALVTVWRYIQTCTSRSPTRQNKGCRSCFLSVDLGFGSRNLHGYFFTKALRCFPQSPETNTEFMLQVRPWRLIFTSLIFHCSLICLVEVWRFMYRASERWEHRTVWDYFQLDARIKLKRMYIWINVKSTMWEDVYWTGCCEHCFEEEGMYWLL